MDKCLFRASSHKKNIFLLLVLSFFFLMFGNNIMSLTHPDEVFYIQTAKEMLRTNNWIEPILFGAPQFEKPILGYVLFAGALKFIGNTPFAARFFPAAMGMVGVLVTYWIAWMLFTNKRIAFFSGCILMTSFIYLALSRAVLTDMIFSVWVIISIGFFYDAYRTATKKTARLIWCGVFSGIAVLTKGALGFVFPVATIFLFLLYKRDLKFLRTPAILWALFLGGVIALPWHILMYQRYGATFIEEYVWNVHVRRLLVAEHPRLDNWYFYLGLMFVGVFPWVSLWFGAGKKFVRELTRKTPLSAQCAFLAAWIAAIYLFVQPAHSKLASYIFPVFPAFAIIFAFFLDGVLTAGERERKQGMLRMYGFVMALVTFSLAVGAIIAARKEIDTVGSMGPIYLFSTFLVVIAVIFFIGAYRRRDAVVILAFPCITVALLITLFFVRPYIETWVSCKEVSDAFVRIDQSDSTVLTSKFYVRGVYFYTDRKMAVIDIGGGGFFSPHPIPFLNTEQKVLDFLATQPVTYAVVKEGNVEDLERILKDQPYHAEHLTGMGGKYILKIERQ